MSGWLLARGGRARRIRRTLSPERLCDSARRRLHARSDSVCRGAPVVAARVRVLLDRRQNGLADGGGAVGRAGGVLARVLDRLLGRWVRVPRGWTGVGGGQVLAEAPDQGVRISACSKPGGPLSAARSAGAESLWWSRPIRDAAADHVLAADSLRRRGAWGYVRSRTGLRPMAGTLGCPEHLGDTGAGGMSGASARSAHSHVDGVRWGTCCNPGRVGGAFVRGVHSRRRGGRCTASGRGGSSGLMLGVRLAEGG